jgi:hypothetical protein
MVVVLIISLLGVAAPTAAQTPEEGITLESEKFNVGEPVMEEPVLFDEVPALTEEQIAQLEWGEANTHLAPEIAGDVAEVSAAPPEGSASLEAETRDRSGEPLAPGDAIQYKWKQFGSSIPSGFKSNVMESSLDGKGGRLFYSGNWFSAYSRNKGSSWTYLSSFTGFSDFCCDQVVIHDSARDIYLWLRMGIPYTDGGGNYENVFKLSVDYAAPFDTSYWTYTIQPMSINSNWTNEWWDYPHMQLGADYLYIAWNLFNQGGSWTRTVMLRINLDNLAAAGSFSGAYYYNTNWFTFVPVSGSHHATYFASNWPSPYSNTNLGVWRWYEDSGGLTFWNKTITAYTPTGRGYAHCGSPNWAARYDQRVLTGARYSIYNANLKYPGRKVLGWWWNVAEGGNFNLPYIEGAAFYEDTMGQVSGNQGRPLIWSSSYCFAYPSTESNKRQDLGMIFNYAFGPDFHKPYVGWALADDISNAPPGWLFYGAAGSSAGPSDQKWGDYNTTRAFQDLQAWIAGAHYIPGGSNCSNCSTPLFFAFGRERDFWGGFKIW